MSAGTEIIQNALQKIGVYSPVSPSNPESIQTTKDLLNSMIAQWQDDDIDMGCVPLKEPGSELSEPLGAKEAIESNLAIYAASYFPGAKVTPALTVAARKGYNFIVRRWQTVNIPKPKTRGTLPKGQGNKQWRHSNPFFYEGEEVGEDITA